MLDDLRTLSNSTNNFPTKYTEKNTILKEPTTPISAASIVTSSSTHIVSIEYSKSCEIGINMVIVIGQCDHIFHPQCKCKREIEKQKL